MAKLLQYCIRGHFFWRTTGILASVPASILILFLVFPYTTLAQWTKTNGPAGGTVTVFAQNSTSIFAGVKGGGVYRSDNGGSTWTQASTGLRGNSLNPTSILVSGASLWLGTEDGLYRSTDAGATWTASGTATFSGAHITQIVSDGTALIVAIVVQNLSTIDTIETASECLFRSVDGGATWTAISLGLRRNAGEVFSTALAQTSSETRIYALSNRDGVFVSTDAGRTWSNYNQGLAGYALRLEARRMLVAGGTLYLCTGDGVYSRRIALTPTQPESATWQAANTGIKGQSVNSIAEADGTLIVGTEADGIFTSTNGGAAWTPANTGLTNLSALALHLPTSPTNTASALLVGTEGAGVFTSPRPTAITAPSWQQASTGILSGQVLSLSVLNNTLFAATYGNGVQISRDGGTTWQATRGINTPPQGAQGLSSYVSKVASVGSRLLAATLGGMFASTDGGTTWQAANGTGAGALKEFALSVYDIAVNPANNRLVAATGDGVFTSSDDGATWVRRVQGLDDSVSIHALAFKGSTMLGGTFESGIFRSNDGGATWREASKGLSITALTVYDMYVGTTRIHAATEDGIYASDDDGRTWTRSSTGLDASNPSMYRILAQGSTLVAVGATGVYRSANGGAAWQSVSQGLTNTSYHALAADNANLYIGDYTVGSGVWKRPVSQVTSVVERNGNATTNRTAASNLQMQLSPNPAHAEVSLRFTVPDAGGRAVITVTDALGRTLYREETTPLPLGAHTHSLPAVRENLQSGLYIVRISIDAASATRLLHFVR